MARIKVQVPGGNFKSIQTGNSTVIQQVIQNRPVVQGPAPSFSSGGGSGTVDSVVAGTGISVDATDPANPIVSIGDTAVSAGSYTNADITVNAQGQITAASDGSGGGVTSVGLEDGSTTPIYTISGSPVTTSGTLEFTLNTQTAKYFLAGPTSGSAAQPTFRTIALADLPAISLEHLSDVSVTPAQGDILYYNGSDWVALAPGTSGYVLETQGAAANPTWAQFGGGSATTIIDQSGGASQTFSVPAAATGARVYLIGGGGGGGGGSSVTSGNPGGGGGGASGNISVIDLMGHDIAGTTLTVVFSNTSGGTGGAGGAAGAHSGVNGTAGSTVSLETAGGELVMLAGGGNGGNGGVGATAGTGGTVAQKGNYFYGVAGGTGGNGGPGSAGANLPAFGSSFVATGYGPTGGGGGAGYTSAFTNGSEGGSGSPTVAAAAAITGGAGGTAGSSGTPGGNGQPGTYYTLLTAGGGGGGANGQVATNASNGGPGAGYGAGGGGGGACSGSTTGGGGTGGNGGYAAAIIVVYGPGIAGPGGANPSASVGLTAVNGTATTFMTSDSAPALSQAIAPTWTGLHKFQPSGSNEAIHVYGATSQWSVIIDGKDTTSDSLGLLIRAGTNSSDYSFYVQDASGTYAYATARGDGLWSFYEPSFGAAALKTVATYDSGSFTGTLTGMTSSTTGTVYWVRCGPMVTLYVGAGFTGTSNANTMTMTGLPTALQPAKEQLFSSICTDSGDYTDCMTIMSASSGTITFYKGSTVILGGELNYVSGQFITSGTKGLIGWSVTYSLI